MFDNLSDVEKKIDYEFKNKNLILRAFTHNSGVKIGAKKSYQNLEFLGDSIVDFVIAEELMRRHPSFDEGQLTRMRAGIVSEKPLAEAIKEKCLNHFLIMGTSETKMGINNNTSVMSDLFESIVGAIYLDGGLRNAKKFIISMLDKQISESECNNNNFYDYKSMLNEFAGRNNLSIKYESTLDEDDMLQTQKFEYVVIVEGEVIGKGEGSSKKEAQQQAAKMAYKKIKKD